MLLQQGRQASAAQQLVNISAAVKRSRVQANGADLPGRWLLPALNSV